MKKIIVCDNRGRFHVFTGDVWYHAGPDGCEIYNSGRARDKKVAHFAQYQWVKEEDLDGLQGRDADFIAHDEAGQLPQGFTPPAPAEPDPFTAKALADRNPPALDHNNLAPGAPLDQEAVNADDADKQPSLSPEEQRDAFNDLKGKYGADINQNAPAPLETESGDDEPEPPPEMTDEELNAYLAQAEAKHKERASHKQEKGCSTCDGTGTVPDHDSDDPLDTTMCPDC